MIILLAAFVAAAFGIIGKDSPRGRAVYGLSVFAKFVGVAFVLAWILYFLPG
jgi:hypothetical protein